MTTITSFNDCRTVVGHDIANAIAAESVAGLVAIYSSSMFTGEDRVRAHTDTATLTDACDYGIDRLRIRCAYLLHQSTAVMR